MNYAEVLLANLSNTGPNSPAILSCHADRAPERLSRGELRQRVATAALALQALDIGAESRVAVVAANHEDTVVSVLAAAALGATIAMVAPDIGLPAMLERLNQVEPVMLICDQDSTLATVQPPLQERIATLVQGLPSLRSIVLLADRPPEQSLGLPVYHFAALTAEQNDDAFIWHRFPFNHPLFVLFTSGTTGAPKCILHGAGGSLIEHLKEHRLHCDLRPGDKLFFQTSTAWMMWQWQLSALASGAEIVLNDAPVISPEMLWQIVAAHHVTVFGTSPSYIQLCESVGYHPASQLAFPALRSVLSTGSILYDWQQDWLTRYVKALPIQSISGGSDIIGCFVLGSPIVPSYCAECQSRSLGLDVQALGAPMEGALAGNRGTGLRQSLSIAAARLSQRSRRRAFSLRVFLAKSGFLDAWRSHCLYAGRFGTPARPVRWGDEHQGHPHRPGGDLSRDRGHTGGASRTRRGSKTGRIFPAMHELCSS